MSPQSASVEVLFDAQVCGWVAATPPWKLIVKKVGSDPASAGPLPDLTSFSATLEKAGPIGTTLSVSLGQRPIPDHQLIKAGSVVAFQFATLSEFGELLLSVREGGAEVAVFELQVSPRNVDAVSDFHLMREAVEQFGRGLAYAFWRRTTESLFVDRAADPAQVEWVFLLKALWSRLAMTLREIALDPDQALTVCREVVPASRVRRVDERSAQWLSANPAAWMFSQQPPPHGVHVAVAGGFAAPGRVSVPRREVTRDTPANRVLRRRVARVWNRAGRVLRSLVALPPKHFAAGAVESYRSQLLEYHAELGRQLRAPHLLETKEAAPVDPGRVHILRSDARYRQSITLLDALELSLSTDSSGPAADASYRETWRVYEMWSYSEVLQYFSRQGWTCEANGARVVPVEGLASLAVELAKGENGRSVFRSPQQEAGVGTRVTVVYHPFFERRRTDQTGPGSLSGDREPDILIRAERGGIKKEYVLDPKYRVRAEDGGTLNCPQEALDDMHVYRDAIGEWSQVDATGEAVFSRTLAGAFALFPSPEIKTAAVDVTELLRVGVGAVPLAPSDPTHPRFDALLAAIVSSVDS